MENSTSMHPNIFINAFLVSLVTGLGFISEQFAEQLKQLSLILTPIVQGCSITSFIIFLIINREIIKQFFRKSKK
jgi:multisubunit Na+/H+ antiporter MnhC subunit